MTDADTTPRARSRGARFLGLIERHPEIVGYIAMSFVLALFALVVGEPGRLPITLAYVVSMPLMLGLPALMVMRHQLRQALVMDRLRGLYAMAEAMVMAGRYDDARQKLRSIKRWERHWKIGNSAAYRAAYGTTVIASTFIVALAHYLLYLNENSYSYGQTPHTSLLQTVQKMSADPWLLWFYVTFSILAALSALPNLRDLKEEPWAAFYSDRLRQLLEAGRNLATPHRHSRDGRRRRDRATASEGATARELFGLSPTFTQAELRRAWLRLVRELHPDRWAHASEAVRAAKEEALKRVNAARDELVYQAIG